MKPSRLMGLGFGALATLTAGFAFGWACQGRHVEPPAAPAAPAIAAPAPAGDAAELLGINEAVSVPARFLQQGMQKDAIGDAIRADAAAAAAVGARWVRAHSAVFPNLSWRMWEGRDRSFDRADLWVRTVQREGLSPLIMVSPWPGNQTGNFTESYEIPDPEAYAEYVRAVVERYDGDGVDDMPGLKAPIHHWEIDNEPDLKNTNVPRGARRGYDPETFCLPEQYAAVLIETAALIREADAEAVVLNGGFYRPMTDTGRDYMARVFAVEGALDAIDALSIHAYYSDTTGDRLRRAIRAGREVAPGKPIWITETNVPSEGKEPWLSEDYQGAMVVRALGIALLEGVEKVFWHTLNDPPADQRRQGPGGMDNHSLYRALPDGGLEEKPAALAWRGMAALLEGVDRSEIAPVEVDGGEGLAIGERGWLIWGDGAATVAVEATEARRLNGEGVELILSAAGAKVELDGAPLLLVP